MIPLYFQQRDKTWMFDSFRWQTKARCPPNLKTSTRSSRLTYATRSMVGQQRTSSGFMSWANVLASMRLNTVSDKIFMIMASVWYIQSISSRRIAKMAFSVVKLIPNASGTLMCGVASQRIQCCYEKLYEMLLKARVVGGGQASVL